VWKGKHCESATLQTAAPLTSGPKIVAFHKYRLSSEIGLAEHLERLAAAATAAAAWVRLWEAAAGAISCDRGYGSMSTCKTSYSMVVS
jgi:hypothetical protein